MEVCSPGQARDLFSWLCMYVCMYMGFCAVSCCSLPRPIQLLPLLLCFHPDLQDLYAFEKNEIWSLLPLNNCAYFMHTTAQVRGLVRATGLAAEAPCPELFSGMAGWSLQPCLQPVCCGSPATSVAALPSCRWLVENNKQFTVLKVV